jgi:hypothetical protein
MRYALLPAGSCNADVVRGRPKPIVPTERIGLIYPTAGKLWTLLPLGDATCSWDPRRPPGRIPDGVTPRRATRVVKV